MKQQVVLLGVTLNVATDATDPLYVLDVARHVEDTAQRLAKACPPKTPRETLAVMTAMEIADELYRKSAAVLPEGRRPQARLDALVRKINAAVGPSS